MPAVPAKQFRRSSTPPTLKTLPLGPLHLTLARKNYIAMSLDFAIKQLALRPSASCRTCRRSLATSSRRQQDSSSNPLAGERKQSPCVYPVLTERFPDLLGSPRRSSPQASRPPATRPQSRTLPREPPRPAPSTDSSAAPAPTSSVFDIAAAAVRESAAGTQRRQSRPQTIADLQKSYNRKDLEQQVTRRWKVGDVYAPHDLSGVEMAKWRKPRRKGRGGRDVLDLLGVKPLDEYKVSMSFFVISKQVLKLASRTSASCRNT